MHYSLFSATLPQTRVPENDKVLIKELHWDGSDDSDEDREEEPQNTTTQQEPVEGEWGGEGGERERCVKRQLL